jgi:SepF-like predicted cell division protein (DUF552 family)
MARKGKFSRPPNNNSSEDSKIANKLPGVKFYSLVDVVRTDRIMNEVEEGNLIFLNIGRIASFPERKREFLKSLKKQSAELHVTLKMVSEETVMVAPNSVPIEIRSLSPVRLDDKKQMKIEE